MTKYSTSDGDAYDDSWKDWVSRTGMYKMTPSLWSKVRVRLLVSSIKDSLNRGSLSWDDEKAWSLLELSYKQLKESL